MKKKTLYTIILSLSIFSCLFFGTKAHSLQEEMIIKEEKLVEEKGNYPEIYNIINSLTVGTFKEKVVNQEDFIVYVGRPTCGDCNNFELDLIQLIQKYDMQDKLAYLNVAQLKKDKVAWKVFKSTYDIQYTPTLAKFEKGQLVNKVEWTPEKGISIQKVDSWIVNHI